MENREIKQRLKKSCDGCRAFDGPNEQCALKFQKKHYEPLEPCPKPRTYAQLIEVKNQQD